MVIPIKLEENRAKQLQLCCTAQYAVEKLARKASVGELRWTECHRQYCRNRAEIPRVTPPQTSIRGNHMTAKDRIKSATGGDRRAKKRFIRSLEETAARAVVTASVTFAVGWLLKRMFENSVAEAAKEGAKAGAEGQPAQPAPAAA
jgi:hypothetical protein